MEFGYSIPERAGRQGSACEQMGSRLYASLCACIARDYERHPALRALLDRYADRSRLALRLLGAAHFRALAGASAELAAHYPSTGGDGDADAAWEAILRDVSANDDAYGALLDRPVQTNEPARAMPVLAALLAVSHATSLPLRIFEIGASAGFMLNFDRYSYAGEGWSWGDASSPLHLRNRASGGAPAHLDAALRVRSRMGCDLHPLDVRRPEDAATLLSFVWADQHERIDRIRAAIAVAKQHPVQLVRADGISWIGSAAQPQPQSATVVLHTVVTEHLERDLRGRLSSAIASLGERASDDAPFAWVRMEPRDGAYETSATLWPGGDCIAVARSDGHAQSLRWTVAAS